MRVPRLIYSFRVRLLVVLAALLLATLFVQYYLINREEQRYFRLIAEQEQALAAGTALALESVSSNQYLYELYQQHKLSLLEQDAGRVRNILVVNDQGEIQDSLDPALSPRLMPDGSDRYIQLSQIPLPPLVDAGQPIDDIRQMLGSRSLKTAGALAGEPRAFPIRFLTTNGPEYIIIVLGAASSAHNASLWRSAADLLPTLAVLLLAILITTWLVWRFTRPISELSEAAKRVAVGDFNFRVPAANRRDEMGALASVFNEMIARLGGMRELEARLHNAERSAVVGRLASAIAHEIRNPLNYINLTLDYLRNSLAPEDETKRVTFGRLADQIKSEVGRMNTRISEFLNYTRPRQLQLKDLELRGVIEDALRLIEVQAADNDIQAVIESSNTSPHVLGDPESLRSVFTNLIINGIQAIDGRGGRLTILLSEEEGKARVDITDTGRGIDSSHISQIFEPYFSTKETGAGLGLAIVRKAVEDHGGTISVASKPGQGATFTVRLPANGSPETQPGLTSSG